MNHKIFFRRKMEEIERQMIMRQTKNRPRKIQHRKRKIKRIQSKIKLSRDFSVMAQWLKRKYRKKYLPLKLSIKKNLQSAKNFKISSVLLYFVNLHKSEIYFQSCKILTSHTVKGVVASGCSQSDSHYALLKPKSKSVHEYKLKEY